MARVAEEKPLSPLGQPRPVSEVLGRRTHSCTQPPPGKQDWGGLAGLLLVVVEERGAGDHHFQKEALMGQRWEVRLLSLHRVDGAPASVQPGGGGVAPRDCRAHGAGRWPSA